MGISNNGSSSRFQVRRARKRKEEPSYQGTFTSAKRHVLHTFAHTHSALMKKRVARYMLSAECPLCHGKRLRPEYWERRRQLALRYGCQRRFWIHRERILDRERLRLGLCAMTLHIDASELGPKQQDLTRVVHPQQ